MTVRRIMLLATGLGIGGAEKQVVDIGTVLQRRGHHVLLVSMVPVGKMGEVAVQRKLAVESLHMRPGIPDPRGVWGARPRGSMEAGRASQPYGSRQLAGPCGAADDTDSVLISTAHDTLNRRRGGGFERAYRLTDFWLM